MDKILIVDDDNDFRKELSYYLQDYTLIQASNADEAFAILKKPNEIGVVILDVMMPGKKGTEALDKIREISPNIGIVILTGYSSKDIVIEALKGHADDYVEKPLDIPKLKEIIDKLLENKRGAVSSGVGGIGGKIEKIKNFTDRNYDRKVSLNDVAQSVFLSPKYLSRVFKIKTGTGFCDYKLGMRIKKAKELLEKTGYNIDQISDKLGYKNAESFIRIFKKWTGFTPTQYRRKKRKTWK